jgi:hypothetical protein
MNESCTTQRLYFTWIGNAILYVALLGYFAYREKWPAFVIWLLFLPCFRLAYLRFFPRLSVWRLGGSGDKLPASVGKTQVDVTYYYLLGCPYCPVVSERLEALQKQMGFHLTKIDLTFKPQVAASKGIRSVPVVEAGRERLVGNVTSEELAELIARGQAA